MTVPVYGLVLAGGKSQRMQQDKSLLCYHGQPQFLYTYQLLEKSCQRVHLSCRPSQAEQYRRAFKGEQISLLTDLYENIGPVAALLTAFQHQLVAWLTLACDIPLMDHPTLQYLLKHRNFDAVATTFQLPEKSFPETMATIWEPAAFPLLQEAYRAQQYSLSRWLKVQNIQRVTPPSTRVLTNVNTPEEYVSVRQLIRKTQQS